MSEQPELSNVTEAGAVELEEHALEDAAGGAAPVYQKVKPSTKHLPLTSDPEGGGEFA